MGLSGAVYLAGVECPFLVLLVGEDEQDGIAEFLFFQHGTQLLLGDGKPFHVRAVHYEDDGVRVGEVAPPVGPDAGLATQVPHLQLCVRAYMTRRGRWS
jgi:hypothetical protein